MAVLNKEGFDIIRVLFGGHMSQSQVDGIQSILTACNDHGITDERHIGYMLATVFHETAKTMQPIEEYLKGKGRRYGTKHKRNGTAYNMPDKLYYGRGYVQITWYDNYEYLGKLIEIDLLNHPELALVPDIAAKIMITGMTKGAFTGVKLSTYFNSKRADPLNARKIINGNDCDTLIAGYYNSFYRALIASNN